MKFKDFMIVTEEELSENKDCEKIKEILINKFKVKMVLLLEENILCLIIVVMIQ